MLGCDCCRLRFFRKRHCSVLLVFAYARSLQDWSLVCQSGFFLEIVVSAYSNSCSLLEFVHSVDSNDALWKAVVCGLASLQVFNQAIAIMMNGILIPIPMCNASSCTVCWTLGNYSLLLLSNVSLASACYMYGKTFVRSVRSLFARKLGPASHDPVRPYFKCRSHKNEVIRHWKYNCERAEGF